MRNVTNIIIGSEDKKLYIYDSILQKPVKVITINEGVKIVRAYPLISEQGPEIIAASLGNRVCAYDRNLKQLWDEEITRDSILSVNIKDINSDGKVEILVGSEDRNLHILDSTGHLLWRYYLPHNVLAVDAANVAVQGLVEKASQLDGTVSSLAVDKQKDADIDKAMEVYVGCEDGYLYVFNQEGDLLWVYHANDRIRAICAEDVDDDGNIEIIIGGEDELELLRIVNQHQVGLKIDQCWLALCQQSTTRKAIEALLDGVIILYCKPGDWTD